MFEDLAIFATKMLICMFWFLIVSILVAGTVWTKTST